MVAKQEKMVRIYNMLEQYDKAYATCLEVIKNYKTSLGEQHPWYGDIQLKMAHSCIGLNKYDEAEHLMQRSIENARDNQAMEPTIYALRLIAMGKLKRLMGKHAQALPYYFDANRIYQDMTYQILGISNEKNKSDFVNSINNHLKQYHSLGFETDYQLDSLNQFLYNNELLNKGLILNSTKKTIAAIRASNDDELQRDFLLWQDLRTQLAQQYSQPIDQRMVGLDSLEIRANLLEQDLVIKSSAFANERSQISWKQVKKELKANEAAIEFVHYRYHNHKPTDSIIYCRNDLDTAISATGHPSPF